MKTCPHCQFLVSSDATTCSICSGALQGPHGRVPQGQVPHGQVPASAPAFVAPGQAPVAAASFAAAPSFTAAPPSSADQLTPPPFPGAGTAGGWPPGAPGSTMPPGLQQPGMQQPFAAPPNQRSSPAKVLAIIGLLCLVPVLALAAIVMLGTTASDEVRAEELFWTPYDEPEGRYEVLMPGVAREHTVEMPDVYGSSGTVESAVVDDPNFVVTVARTPDSVPSGMSFDTLPFSPTAAALGIEEMGLADAELTSHGVVEGTDGTALEMEFRGTVDGADSIFLSRVVIGGADLYELNVVGPLASETDLRAMHDRLVASFALG